MKKTRKKMILSATVLTALALFAGCTRANAASPAPTAARIAETAPAARTITLEEAKAIAYAHAGVSESDALDKSYERDDGIYEIDFEHGGFEYDYDISRQGEILKVEKEPERTEKHAESKPTETKPAQTKSDRIRAEKALSIALDHAGITNARDRDVEWDDGRWEVSFESCHTEYEYDISADGTILRWEKEIDD